MGAPRRAAPDPPSRTAPSGLRASCAPAPGRYERRRATESHGRFHASRAGGPRATPVVGARRERIARPRDPGSGHHPGHHHSGHQMTSGITGVIQAGGKSRRMGGEPKALIELGGRRIIDRVVAVMADVTDDLLIVTNTPELYAFLGLPMVADAFPDGGSLGGIYSGLKAAAGGAAFTVACDMPFLVPGVARLVVDRAGEADVVIPRSGGQLETLHACYAKSCLSPMETRLRQGQLRITGFFEDVRVLEISEEEIARVAPAEVVFMNVNTPEELDRARVVIREAGS